MKLKAFLKSAEDILFPRAKISLWGLGAFISQAGDTKQVTQVTPGPKGSGKAKKPGQWLTWMFIAPPLPDNIRLERRSLTRDDPLTLLCCGRVWPWASWVRQEYSPRCTGFVPRPWPGRRHLQWRSAKAPCKLAIRQWRRRTLAEYRRSPASAGAGVPVCRRPGSRHHPAPPL